MPENPLKNLAALDPAMMKKMGEDDGFVFSDGALPKKVKYLIALAFDASHGAAGGVGALARQAMAAGATREEIAETLRVVYHLSGVGGLYTASFGLEGLV
jgi:alkylhydroperoxidase/carboxymuconolactone decarboxylase family protein YurZ